MNIKTYIPHPALQELVLNISTIEATLPPSITEVVTPYPPTPFQSIIFYCNNPISMGKKDDKRFNTQPNTVIVGPQYSHVNIKVTNQLRAVRADFAPGGMHRLLHISMHELFDNGYDAIDFFGANMRELNDMLSNILDIEKGKSIVENFLLEKAKALKVMLPIDIALLYLFQMDGNISMEQTASMACMSLRQFERKCNERIGMSPKLYSRILRFSKAYRLREAFPEMSWTQIAHKTNYYDQMHMIRDFKVFAGVNPSIIEQQLYTTPLRMQKDLPL